MNTCHDPRHATPCPQPCAACAEDCDPQYLRELMFTGAPVWWHRTLGGGGGSGARPNPKDDVEAYVITVSVDRVKIYLPHRQRATWVRWENVRPREGGTIRTDL
jgi:hypothetical protein